MSKIKKVIICILACLCASLSCASIASVLARYVAEKGGFGSIGDGGANDLPYEISSPIVVNTQEELFEALQYGYSYVKLGDNLKNPFLVTEKVTNMSRSLILDINGKQIQRNSRDPMLSIPNGITLTILDSSVGKTGGLYNPVGSVLSIEGGVLTVTGGKFESGPRLTEYYSYFTDTSRTGVHNRIDKDSNNTQFTVSERSSTGDTVETTTKIMPVFTPVVTLNGGLVEHVDGNVYFNVDWKDANNTIAIPADTYCYYVTSDGFSTGDTIDFSSTAADFSYSYYAEPTTYSYISSTEPSGTKNVDYVEVTIYAYKTDIQTAIDGRNGKPSNFAAVKMLNGELNINVNSTNPDAGSFYTYFGVKEASCIYTQGGTMNINTTGTFSTVNPELVGNINQNGLAVKGEDICIRTSTENTGVLNINKGTFRSYVGDIVDMYGGEINVYGGSFEKDATVNSKIHQQDLADVNTNTQHGTNGACIDSHGGEIYVEGSSAENKISFVMRGSGVSCISTTRVEKEVAPKVTCINCIFTVDSSALIGKDVTAINNVGVYNREGEVTLNNCEFTMDGYNALGIVSVDSSISATTGEGIIDADLVKFEMGGERARGIYQKSGETTIHTGIFSMKGAKATGIVASSGTVNIGNAPTLDKFRPESELGVPQGAVFFYIDRCYDCYGIKAGINNSIAGDNVGTIPADSQVTINLNSCQVLLGQGKVPATGSGSTGSGEETPTGSGGETPTGSEDKFYYEATLEALRKADKEPNIGEVVCAGIFSNLDNAQINVTRAHFVIAGAYSAAIHAQKGTVTQTATEEGNYGKLSALVGSHYVDYTNGGKTAAGKWIYSTVSENVFNVDDFEGASKVHSLESNPVVSSFGIMSAGGDITLDRAFIRLKGEYSSGIYSTGGAVTINEQLQELIVDETPNPDEISTTAIFVSDGKDASGNLKKGKITIRGTGNNIKNGYTVKHKGAEDAEDEVLPGGVGIVVNSSSVLSRVTGNSFELLGDLDVSCSESTAVLISGGSVYIKDGVTLNVNSTIRSKNNDNLNCLDYKRKYVIEKIVDGETKKEVITETTQNYAGVKITGGTLTCDGTLNINHNGLWNDEHLGIKDFATFAVNSFALNVNAKPGDVIKIANGNITNSCGGGVAVSGGNLQLGIKDSISKSVDVSTTGNEYYTVYHKDNESSNDNWGYYIMKTGGYAVSVRGGNAEVNGGTYQTALGSAFLVKRGNAVINDGTFIGKDTSNQNENNKDIINYYGIGAGPAAHYSLAMYGGELTVNGGTFGSSDGSAGIMVRGMHQEENTSGNRQIEKATLVMNKGTVYSGGSSAGICLFEHAHVTLGAEGRTDSDVQVTAGSSAVTVESSYYCSSDENSESDTKLTVNSGTYFAHRYGQGQWTNVLYDAVKGAEINITGGHFKCKHSLVVYFNMQAIPANFKISGGTFESGTDNFANRFFLVGTLDYPYNNALLSDILADGYDFYISDVAVDKTTQLNDISGATATVGPATPVTPPTEPEVPSA